MKVSREMKNLVSGDVFRSALDHVRRLASPISAAPLLVRFESDDWRELEKRYAGDSERSKFGRRVQDWMRTSLERAQDLRLHRESPLRILDLGCGPGYFLYVCSHLGHSATGIDIDRKLLFKEAAALLGVDRRIAPINPRQPLPRFGERFDLVTAYGICFDKVRSGKGSRRRWTVEEWQFFLDDIQDNVLHSNGRLVLSFNAPAHGSFIAPAVREMFLQRGGFIRRRTVLFKNRS
jgi:SAM-dependent methyltransferase